MKKTYTITVTVDTDNLHQITGPDAAKELAEELGDACMAACDFQVSEITVLDETGHDYEV